jgi:hypothetical protein
MPVPNNTPDSVRQRRSIAEMLWQTRKTPSKKDFWDKADIVGKFAIALLTGGAAVVIPIAVATIGNQVQKVISAQNTGKDYITIALGILERKDLPEDMQKNEGLREWAVGLLRYYSPVHLTN